MHSQIQNVFVTLESPPRSNGGSSLYPPKLSFDIPAFLINDPTWYTLFLFHSAQGLGGSFMLLHASIVYFFLLLRNKSTIWMYYGLSVYLLIDLACLQYLQRRHSYFKHPLWLL